MMPFRIGQGYDCHALGEARPLIIGGVRIDHHKGLIGHSDADVLLHAIIDALFGALALGDIGTHFPDTDKRFLGVDSRILFTRAVELIKKQGYTIGNIDATVIAEQPKLAPYILSMRENIASDAGIDMSCVSVKAKTNERLGYIGREQAIAAQAIVLLAHQ